MGGAIAATPFQRGLMVAVLIATAAFATSTVWMASQAGKLENRIEKLEERNRATELPVAAGLPEPGKFVVEQGPPIDSYEVQVIAKQWLWKFQHPSGVREVDELHLPVGRPVKFTIVSEDVIHRFDVPGLKLQAEAGPGRYTSAWGTLVQTGRFEFACGQYCGVHHAKHKGTLSVMEPADFERWLGGGTDTPGDETTLTAAGRQNFLGANCLQCHTGQAGAKAPSLEGRYRGHSALKDGSKVVFDENHIRESIRRPLAKIADGWEPIMPPYDSGLLSEEGLVALVEFVKSLKPGDLEKLKWARAPLNDRFDRIRSTVDQPRLEPLRRLDESEPRLEPPSKK